MGLVNQTLPGLYGGVSQQAPELRHDTQVSEMVNCYPTIIGGVQKRPPTVVAYNDDTFPTDSFIYAYDRGAGSEQYIIAINSEGQYRFFDVTLNSWINLWTTHSYLTIPIGAKAKDSFAMSTAGDTTFVVNKTIDCALSTTTDDNDDPDWDTTFYYWVKRTAGANDETNRVLRYYYYVYDDDTEVAAVVNHDSTDAAAGLATAIGGTSQGSVVRKLVTDGSTYSGADSWGNQASESYQGQVTKLQDLPSDFGFEGAIMEITGDEDTSFDSYYVKYDNGVWKETFRPGLANGFNSSTMPHKIELRRLTDTPTYHYDFDVIDWTDRQVGDDKTASEPSFIGQNIQDVFFYRNRLGFLAGDNVILSESGEYYNFWPTTVTDIMDSDVIDVAVDSNQAISLRFASPFNKELLLFGDKAQFVLSASDVLTPKDVSVQQSTAFDIKDVAPVVMGPNAYFATEKNNWSSIREYFVQPDSLSSDAADITAHCPNYIPKNITKLTGSNKNDMLFALSSDTTDTIYVYNFYWQGEEKAQSAWHKWTFSGVVLDIEVLGSTLLVIINRNGDINLETIALENNMEFTDIAYSDAGTYTYEAKIALTKPGFPTGQNKIDDYRGKFLLKGLAVGASYGSFYNVIAYRYNKPRTYFFNSGSGLFPSKDYIYKKEYNISTSEGIFPSSSLYPSTNLLLGSETYAMNSDHRYTIAGNVDNLELVFTNNITSGFRINTLDIVGNYIKHSRTV